MPIDLHPDCIDRLREKLPEALASIVITSNHYIDYDSVSLLSDLESVLPEHGDARDQLERAIGREPFSTFVLDQLRRTLRLELPFEVDARTRLDQLRLTEGTDALANRFLDEFQSLPWKYAFLYQIPSSAVEPLLPTDQDEFGLAEDAAFVRWTADRQNSFAIPPNESLTGLPGGLFGPPKPTDGNAYLQTLHSGYVPEFGSSPAADEAERTLRAICGVGVALRVWERGWGSGLAGFFGPTRAHVYVWRRTDAGWAYMAPRELPAELGEAVARLRIARKLEEFGSDISSKWTVGQFRHVRQLCENEHGLTIMRACRWLFDSYVGSNELLSFIQATVAAEILLGDKAVSDLTGLIELLANRCAYLVGESRTQREQLLSDFRSIYRTRSRIVHRGLDQLDPADEDRLWQLRWLCARIIQRELELLNKDRDPGS